MLAISQQDSSTLVQTLGCEGVWGEVCLLMQAASRDMTGKDYI